MALGHRKVWQHSLKNSVSSPNLFDKVWIGIKDKFKAFPYFPWTVKGSGDGATGGMDNTDRLIFGNLYPGGAWIVLYQAALGLHMCLQRSTPFPSAQFSYVGFTGGTATVRPTAVDEWGRTSLNGLADVFGNPVIYNVAHSTDGKCTYAWTSSAPAAVLTTWIIGEAAEPAPGWTKPHFALLTTVSGNLATTPLCGFNNGINDEILTQAIPGEPVVFTNATRIWGSVPMVNATPVNVACAGVNPTTGLPTILNELGLGMSSYAAKGPMGVLPDIRPVCGGAEGDLMYGRRWIRHGNVVLPWDGLTAYP